jgi:hypothetical protein
MNTHKNYILGHTVVIRGDCQTLHARCLILRTLIGREHTKESEDNNVTA